MVKSLDELIGYLLDEIALSGEQGATTADILSYVETFYNDDTKAATDVPKNDTLNRSVSRQPVDRAFQEKVWKWLTRHSDVYAGRKKEGNELTLGEAEAISSPKAIKQTAHHTWPDSKHIETGNKGDEKSALPVQAKQTVTPALEGKNTLAGSGQDGDQTDPAPAPAQTLVNDSASITLHSKDSKALRVYVSEERMWYAVAGHAPDLNRMQRMDFKLLSTIAAHREKGILQPDLTRISGQDKRSTPLRTQRLHDKGYIEKKKVLTRGQVTSLCTLRKFVTSSSKTASYSTGVGDEVIRRGTSVTKAGPQEELIDVKAMLRRIFDILHEYTIVTYLDLKRKLGFLGRRWPMRILSRTIRKLEIMGCLRRVKARSQYERHDRYFHRCVKLIREPEKDEWQLFWDPMRGLPAHLRENGDDNDAMADVEGDEEDEEDEEEMDANAVSGSQEPEGNGAASVLQEIGRPVPQWTPHQNLNNFLFDIVSMSDTRGLSTMDIKALGVGNFYRRPIEHQLSRLVDAWQLSQPLNLRHLAIVRDTAISKTVAHYVHYSYESFEKLVNTGKSSWEAVEIVRKDSKAKKKRIEAAPIGTEPELDEYGFARLPPDCFQGRANNTTILESVLAAKLEPFYIGRLDPIAVRLEDGTYGIKFRSDLAYNQMDVPMPLSSPRRPQKEGDQIPGKPWRSLGRPRKYPKGEEPYSSGNLQKRKRWKASIAAARRYKVMKVKESGLKLGVEEVETLNTPSVNGAMLDDGVTKEKQSERGPEVEEIQRPQKRSATDAELTGETEKENHFAASKATMSAIPPKKRLRVVEKQREYAASLEEVFDDETIRVGTPGDDNTLPSHPSVAPSSKELQASLEQRPQKKTKRAVEGGAHNLQPKDDLAVFASAGISLTYEEQAQLLGPRPVTGVYIGQRVSRKGGRGRPPKSRLLIARSLRLNNFTWFVEEPPPKTVATPELVPNAIPSVQSSAPEVSTDIPSFTGISTVSAPVIINADSSSITNAVMTPVGSTDVVATSIPMAGTKRKRTPSISGSTILEWGGKDAVPHIAAQDVTISEPALKRRELIPVFEKASLSNGPVQESTLQHATGNNDAPSNAPSEDDDNDAIRLLNDVMHADRLESPPVDTDAVTQVDLLVSGEGNTGPIYSLNTDHQDQVLCHDSSETLQSPSGLPEVVAQIASPENVPKEFPQSRATVESAENHLIEDRLTGERSLDIKSSALSLAGDASVSEAGNTIDAQTLGAAQSFEQSTEPTVAQTSTSHEKPQEVDKVSDAQIDEGGISRQEDTQQVTAVSVCSVNLGTASSPGKQVTDPPSPTVEKGIWEPGRKRARTSYPSRSMIAMGGGSVGAQRRKIIMEIIERCRGLFPGEKELWYPFASAWMKTPDAGKPDQRTIKMATKALIDSGKLRQLTFSFRDKKGIMLTKTILTMPHISPTSPAVKDLEKKIIEEDPNPYIPPEADVTPEIRKTNQRSLSKLVPSKNMAVEKDDKVELQYIPAFVKHAEMSKKVALERRRIREEALMGRYNTEGNSLRGGDAMPESLPRRRVEPFSKGNKPGRVQRLARLQRPFGFRPQVLPSPPPTFTVNLPLNQKTGPISDLELPSDDPIFSIWQAPREMHSDPALQRKHRVDYEALGLGRSIHTSQGFPIRREQPAVSEVGPRLSNSKSGLSSFGTSKARPYQYWSRKSRDSSYNQHIVTLLNPRVVFHPPTGTFSTEYLTLRKSRKQTRVEPASYRVRMPHRLEDITLNPDRSSEPDHTNTDDPAKSKFDWAVDAVQEWELENVYAVFESSKDFHFINHSLNKNHESIQYDVGEELFEPQEWEPGMTTKEIRANYFKRAKQSRMGVDTRQYATLETAVPKPAKRPSLHSKLKTRRLTSVLERNTTSSKGMSNVDSATPDPLRTAEPRKLRGPQTSRYMPLATVHRIMTAVVVIRTITGGLERNIDWVLIAQLFEDQFEPSFVQSRWSTILQKNRLHVERLQADFQDIFIEAYENNVIPPIDYDNLEDYDWAWLVDWAQKKLEMPDTRTLPSLPGNRKQLDDIYDLRTEKEPEIETLFEFNSGATLLKRISVATAAPFTLPVQPRQHKTQDAHKERLSVAKSWVRANVITPEEVYNPEEARRKLLSAGEDTIESALRELISDKILQQENRGRLVPGRNYDISASFLNNLKKNLEATHFRQAAAYKLSLDRSFAEHGIATHSYHASDGDVLALTNLLAHNRVTIHPCDPPRNKFGLTDGGYKTRFMDKSRLNFAVDIRPSPTYIYGNPLLPLPPPPQQHMAHPHPTLEGRIPAWFDIHGNLVPVMWEMALAACLATLALRPGMGARQMAKTFKGSLEGWEVERVLEWLVAAGAATKVGGQGYVLREWWWACLWVP